MSAVAEVLESNLAELIFDLERRRRSDLNLPNRIHLHATGVQSIVAASPLSLASRMATIPRNAGNGYVVAVTKPGCGALAVNRSTSQTSQ